jgi:hypothetical protein
MSDVFFISKGGIKIYLIFESIFLLKNSAPQPTAIQTSPPVINTKAQPNLLSKAKARYFPKR